MDNDWYEELISWISTLGSPYDLSAIPTKHQVEDFYDEGENPYDTAVQWINYLLDQREV